MRDIILQLLQLQPFRPFRLRLTCGAVHEVHDPALARLNPKAYPDDIELEGHWLTSSSS